MMKKAISFVLVLTVICISVVFIPFTVSATQSRSENFNPNYTITGNGATDIVNIAAAQLGKTGAQLGYSEDWCADFVSDCALLANQSEAIPANGLVSSLMQGIIDSGGQYVDANSAQPGDIAFYGTAHTEIIYAVSGGAISTYGGNSGSTGNLRTNSVKNHSTQSMTITKIVRPNYKNLPVITGTQTISDGEYHIVSMLDDGKGIDVLNASLENGANIDLYPNINAPEQVFDITYLGDGSYKIINQHSGKSLDCKGANISPGTNLQQWDYKGEPQQQWIIKETGDGESFYIISKKSGLCIDVNNASTEDFTNIMLYTPNQSTAQKWKFITWGRNIGRTVSDGEYHIASKLNTKMCLDVHNADKADGANIDLYSNLTSSEQVFEVSYLGDGYYKIINKHTGKSLDLNGGKCVSGTNIHQWKYDNVDQQKWVIKPSSDGKAFYIISKKGGLFVDVNSGEAVDLQNIHGYISNGSAAQQWRFTTWQGNNPQKTVAEGEYRIVTAINENKALDIAGGKTDLDTNVQIYSNLASPKQRFRLEYLNNGFYTIRNTNSNLVLDVAGDSVVNNANVFQYSAKGSLNQEWLLKESDDGYYYMIAHSNGLALNVSNGSDQDGANVTVYTQNQTKAQKWKLRRVLTDDMVTIGDVTIKEIDNEIQPVITVTVDGKKLLNEIDYQIQITADPAGGKGVVTVTGINNYCDSIAKEFAISISGTQPTDPVIQTDPPTDNPTQPVTENHLMAILGDADGDGTVTIFDATTIQRHLAELPTQAFVEDAADCDSDGSITVLDATAIQRHLADLPTQAKGIGKPIA